MGRPQGNEVQIGVRVRLSGGYDYAPTWLGDRTAMSGTVVAWIPGQNQLPACVVEFDEPLTAQGLTRGTKSTLTGRYAVLELRHVGETWRQDGVVHVELCQEMPDAAAWTERRNGAWVESNATYLVVSEAQ